MDDIQGKTVCLSFGNIDICTAFGLQNCVKTYKEISLIDKWSVNKKKLCRKLWLAFFHLISIVWKYSVYGTQRLNLHHTVTYH